MARLPGGVDVTVVRGRRLDGDDGLEPAVRAVFEPRLDDVRSASSVAIVPDAHYPFHPSTGMVTDPAVVCALVAVLEHETDADVAVVGTSSDVVDHARTARYLGYPSALADVDARSVDLDDTPRVRQRVRVAGKPTSVAVPERLLESTVVVVPTLRPTREGPVAGALRTLARHVDCADRPAADSAAGTVAASEAVEPTVALLDATVAFGGEPYAANALFAGEPVAVDAVAATLLGRDPADDGAIALATGDDRLAVDVPGVDLDELGERVPSGDLPPSARPHPLVSNGYRLYAAVSGDAVPPQLDRGR